jgi:hypothetical protein
MGDVITTSEIGEMFDNPPSIDKVIIEERGDDRVRLLYILNAMECRVGSKQRARWLMHNAIQTAKRRGMIVESASIVRNGIIESGFVPYG